MSVAEWAFLQLLSYSIPSWIAFAVIAFLAARSGAPGVIAGHSLVAILIVGLDLVWIRAEMQRADWAGTPDLDLAFSVGVFLRIVLINTVLLPISVLGLLSLTREEHSGSVASL